MHPKNPQPNPKTSLKSYVSRRTWQRAEHSLRAESALLLQLPVPEDGGGRRDGVDGAGEHLRRAILVGVDGRQQRVLTDLGGDWRREDQVTPPANASTACTR